MKAMQIGEVAKRSGVGIETIRYYEREGLLSEPQRRPSGYRLYDAASSSGWSTSAGRRSLASPYPRSGNFWSCRSLGTNARSRFGGEPRRKSAPSRTRFGRSRTCGACSLPSLIGAGLLVPARLTMALMTTMGK